MDLVGAGAHVIERFSGRVLLFASDVPPDRILEEYHEVVDDGVPLAPPFRQGRWAQQREGVGMVSQEEAERIAAGFMRAPADDADYGWVMREFQGGWLVMHKWDEDDPGIGAGSYVVERASGRMLHFPSYITPDLILADYDDVADEGSPLGDPLR